MTWRQAFRQSPLARRLIIWTVLFSSAVTLILTGLQLFRDYQRDLGLIEQNFVEIQTVHLPTLIESLWATDRERLQLQLNGMLQLRDFNFFEIREGDTVWARAGQNESANVLRRGIPMRYRLNGQEQELGSLQAVATLDNVYRRLLNELVAILISNALKTFLVAIFMLLLIHAFVTRHLLAISRFAERLDLNTPTPPLQLDRNPREDELRTTVVALNHMHARLIEATITLSVSEARYRTAFEQAAVGMAHVAPDGRWLHVNQKLCQIVGYTRAELLVKTFQDITHPDDLEADLAQVQQVLAGEIQTYTMEKRYFHKDGRIVWINLSVSLVRDAAGKPDYFIAVVEDIDTRKRVDSALTVLARGLGEQSLDQLLYEVVQQLSTIYGARYAFIGRLVDPQRKQVRTRAVWAGDRLVDNFTYDLDGTPCQDILNHDAELIDRDAWQRYPKDAMLKDMGVESYFGMPMVSSEGKLFGLVSVMDTKPMALAPWMRPVLGVFATRLANELERDDQRSERDSMLVELTSRNTEMENFVYTISHDLKSPLITIGGFTSLLERDIGKGDAAAVSDSVDEIKKAVGQMQGHIHDLLLLSRTGRVSSAKTDLPLAELIEEAIGTFGRRIEGEGTQLTIATDLPVIRVDRQGLLRVFTNLIDNALKYRRPEIALHIEIGWRLAGEELQLFVRDNGQGIKPEYQQRIFVLFQRADSSTEGTGVGLAISKRVIEVHGGRMWVESKPGEGSTFWMGLPASVIVTTTTASR